LSHSIGSIFHCRSHFFIPFSRTIACSIVECLSNHTRRLMLCPW
jgi:hypothetical protein